MAGEIIRLTISQVALPNYELEKSLSCLHQLDAETQSKDQLVHLRMDDT